MVLCKKFILVKEYDGIPKESDVKIVEQELPPVKDNEFLAETVFLSVDPYFRIYPGNVGEVVKSTNVAKIIESKNPKYPVGKYIMNDFGMVTHYVGDGTSYSVVFPNAYVLPDLGGLPVSLALGILGFSGYTAYFGLFDITNPKEGETVVISGAAGGIGNIVGQLAKVKGCKVIGIVSTDKKGKWLVDELKFDGYASYKDEKFEENLKKVTPSGIDIYFDNVGAEVSSIVMRQMNTSGRVSVCGVMAAYNATEIPKASIVQTDILSKQLRVQGFTALTYTDRYDEASKYITNLIKEGKLKYKEDITQGFENTFKAFISMLTGGNIGKAIVKV